MNSDEEFKEYHNYLRRRSWKGELYVKKIIYPRICRYVKGKVLDIGCGTGDFLECCAGATGVDVNFHNIDYCQSRGLEALHTDGEKFPFKRDAFDSVVIDNVLEHIEEPDSIIAEIRRVLKDKGILVVGVPGKKGFAHDRDHKRFYDEITLDEVITRQGFESINKFYMPLIKSKWLDKHSRRYYLYGVYIAG